MKKDHGFTLIEVIIYLALFTIIIGISMVTVFSIVQNSDKTQAEVIVQEEANFIFRKLDWAITGASAITNPPVGSNGTDLRVTKSTGNIEIQLLGVTLRIKESLGFSDLNNSNVNVFSLMFQHVAGGGGKPESIITTFTLTDNYGHNEIFTQTKYLRR